MTLQNIDFDFSEADILLAAQDVLDLEAQAISNMSENLSESFYKAVIELLKVKQRVIISGIGKSGHIGRKFASTLASTGTPAQFVHPAEASHGDLGMITNADVVVLISNSGETKELSDVIAHTKRFGIPLIAITKNLESTLGTQSDIVLLLPNAPEACSVGMAPTTSTTCTLALSDALAVTVMRMRGFKKENFLTFHPGGKLGAELILTDAIMHRGKKIPVLKKSASMADVLIEMTSKGFGVTAVVDEEESLVGIITDGDLRRNMDDLMNRTAGDIATYTPVTIFSGSLASEALYLMNKHKVTSLFVIDRDNNIHGLVHVHDCLRIGLGHPR